MTALAVHAGRKVQRVVWTTRVWRRLAGNRRATFAQQTSLSGTPPNVPSAAGGTNGLARADGPLCGWPAK